jgi:hypothetical protein
MTPTVEPIGRLSALDYLHMVKLYMQGPWRNPGAALKRSVPPRMNVVDWAEGY